jgi:predicted nuclease with TOPRIM domain
MTTLTENLRPGRTQLLKSLREDLSLYQEETHFFCKLLRKAVLTNGRNEAASELKQLLSRINDFRQETLPNLQRAVQCLDGQTAHSTKADSGLSQIQLFAQSMEDARRQLNIIKRCVFQEIQEEDFMRSRIW